MTLIRVIASALMMTLIAAGAATTDPTRSVVGHSDAAEVVLTLLGASAAAQARMCDPACRYRCC